MVAVAAVAFGEEAAYRGYPIKNLAEGVAKARWGIVIAVVIPAVFFGLAHATNGNATWLSVFNLIIFGLLFGTGYVLTGELALPIGLHFACRQTGVTSRGLLDYMIAAVAIRRDLPPLAWDADMVRLADVTGLRLDSATAKD